MGMVWTLLDTLRALAPTHAPNSLPSLLHILTDLYLVDDRHEDGDHEGVSGRGIMPPPIPFGALIERAQTTCNSGCARSQTM